MIWNLTNTGVCFETNKNLICDSHSNCGKQFVYKWSCRVAGFWHGRGLAICQFCAADTGYVGMLYSWGCGRDISGLVSLNTDQSSHVHSHAATERKIRWHQ